jgi:amino acid transporter
VDFFYLALAQLTGNDAIAELTRNVPVNVATCLAFVAVAAWVSYRGMEATKVVQYVLVAFQLLVLLWFSVAAFGHVAGGTAFDGLTLRPEWFNPLGIDSFSAFAAGVSLSVFIYWGWDVVLTLNEESRGAATTPGKSAIATILVIVALYMAVALAVLSYSGISAEGLGLGNEEIQENIFASLAGPVMGPFAILMSLAVLSSSAASLQSTMISPARTMLAMGHYGALPAKYARIASRFRSPGYATVASAVIASVFYAVMRVVSENVLWDTITTLGMMVCSTTASPPWPACGTSAATRCAAPRTSWRSSWRRCWAGSCCWSSSCRRPTTRWTRSTAPARRSAGWASCSCWGWASCCWASW